MGQTKKEILLHSCCAPCSTYVIDLLSQNYTVTAFFCNSNIHPEKEHEKRLGEMRRLCEIKSIHLLVSAYNNFSWAEIVKGLEEAPEGGERCGPCFKLRLQNAADEAFKNGISMFATTLTVSPHKNAALINRMGNYAESKTGVKFMENDFKKNNGYKKSCELTKQYRLYRQNYCGCIYSIRK